MSPTTGEALQDKNMPRTLLSIPAQRWHDSYLLLRN